MTKSRLSLILSRHRCSLSNMLIQNHLTLFTKVVYMRMLWYDDLNFNESQFINLY